jgi:hypothetical protein
MILYNPKHRKSAYENTNTFIEPKGKGKLEIENISHRHIYILKIVAFSFAAHEPAQSAMQRRGPQPL